MRTTILASLMVLGLSLPAAAYGPHDPNCVECHSLHAAKGKAILAVAPNTKEKNPSTGAGAAGDVALCLGCHNESEGIMPISLTSTHPVGMKPAKLKIDGQYLKDDGSLGCMSCHDPHPSNPNYKYLRGSVAKGSELGTFCALCHPAQADSGAFSKSASPAQVPAKKP